MTKWIATIATAVAALAIVSTTLVLIFGSVDETPYLVEFLLGGGIPFLAAGSVYRHFKAKESTAPPTQTSQQ